MRESIETADPPQSGPGMGDLAATFSISRWEGGRLAVYSANEDAPGGRPFLDAVEIHMARPLREQSIDLELGKADVVEVGPGEARRLGAGRKLWSSAPVRLLALVFGPHVTDSRVREALALSVDRAAIHNVLFQRQGDITGALLPQWISGYAFVFPTAADPGKGRNLIAALPPPLRSLTLSLDDAAWRPVADRIALNARDAGVAVTVGAPHPNADVRLVEIRVTSAQPWEALANLAASLGLPQPARGASTEALYAAERALLEGFHVVPLFHLPYFYAAGPRVHGGPGITPLGEWHFENLWVEGVRP
jgi:MarR-like DNA-binding transcriptional regulator SgrR of sgrS sRNA